MVLCILGTVLILVAGSMADSAGAERGKKKWVFYCGVVILASLGTVLHRWSFMLEGI